jgi:hypothetical protein
MNDIREIASKDASRTTANTYVYSLLPYVALIIKRFYAVSYSNHSPPSQRLRKSIDASGWSMGVM